MSEKQKNIRVLKIDYKIEKTKKEVEIWKLKYVLFFASLWLI